MHNHSHFASNVIARTGIHFSHYYIIAHTYLHLSHVHLSSFLTLLHNRSHLYPLLTYGIIAQVPMDLIEDDIKPSSPRHEQLKQEVEATPVCVSACSFVLFFLFSLGGFSACLLLLRVLLLCFGIYRCTCVVCAHPLTHSHRWQTLAAGWLTWQQRTRAAQVPLARRRTTRKTRRNKQLKAISKGEWIRIFFLFCFCFCLFFFFACFEKFLFLMCFLYAFLVVVFVLF